jgi:hypothetical protein
MSCPINLLFLPYHNTGGHFIDWSLRYLGGQISITNDVSILKNWHHNHIPLGSKRMGAVGGFDDTVNIINQVKNSSNRFENIYITGLHLNVAAKKLFRTEFENLTSQQQQAVVDYGWQDYRDLLSWSQSKPYTVAIFDYCDFDLYSSFYNDRCILDHNGIEYNNLLDMMSMYEKTFYANTAHMFDQEVWDLREKLALIYQFPKKIKNFHEFYNSQLPHYYYNTDDVWNNLLDVVKEILSASQIKIVEENVRSWSEIYNQWRTVHDPWFSRHLDRILDAIVNNKFLSLKRFNMNFFKEVVIQHELITKYNLNLKTFNLVTFPENTQDLYKLLEPNIHKL